MIESNFSADDLKILREVLQSNETIQNERLAQFIPNILQILKLKNSDEFICERYILKRN